MKSCVDYKAFPNLSNLLIKIIGFVGRLLFLKSVWMASNGWIFISLFYMKSISFILQARSFND